MITRIKGKCQFEGCEAKAEFIACGRELYDDDESTCGGHASPAFYCKLHAETVADERNPEYIESCPNCGCMFGVN